MGNYAGKPRGSMSLWWFDTSCFQHLQGVLGSATEGRVVWSCSVVTTVGVGSDCEASLQRTLLLNRCYIWKCITAFQLRIWHEADYHL